MADITLASWNVNSLRVRLEQVLAWLGKVQPDALVLQETKLVDEQFPQMDFEAAGYHALFCGQKTYNGVALLARKATFSEPEDVRYNNDGFPDDQKRLIAATLKPVNGEEPVRFIGGYIPNGSEPGSWKYLYKLDWFEALARSLREELKNQPRLVMGGDFNLAPDDRDVWDPLRWKDRILCSVPERQAYRRLLELGLSDSYRLIESAGGHYSWWDYRSAAFEKNMGLRIDLLLVSDALKDRVKDARIDEEPRNLPQPSDHAPVLVTLG